MHKILATLTAFLITALPASAMADGVAVDWQLGLQAPASPSAEHIHDFHNLLLYIITAIAVFVLILLAWVVIRYNSHMNPTPSQFSHNVMIEVLWTVVPVIILIVIVLPSFKLLYYNDRTENPDMTLKITGYQWYWGYEYPDHGGINFLSYMVPDAEIKPEEGQKRLLSVDNVVVLPVEKNIQILVNGGDVLHSWAVPALGIKMDAIPGRLNETWVRINKPGTYYGQCSELCGKDHSYMPIEIRAVTEEEFNAWVEKAKQEFTMQDNLEPKTIQFAYLEGR